MYCKVVFLFCLFIIQPWFYPVVKYCFNAICFTRFIFVIVSSIISCNDLYQDFIIMYVWYFVSRNSISVLGAIWPSLSPCTVINSILLTYLLTGHAWTDRITDICLGISNYTSRLGTCKSSPMPWLFWRSKNTIEIRALVTNNSK